MEAFEGRFSSLLRDRMESAGLSIREVAEMVGTTYEHVRKCVRGLVIPSKYLAREFSKAMAIDLTEIEEAINEDSIRRKFGALPTFLSVKNPEMEPVEKLWGQLQQDQQHELLERMKMLARRNHMAKTS